MGMSAVCFLYILAITGLAAMKTELGRKVLRSALEFVVLPFAAALVALAAIGILFSVC